MGTRWRAQCALSHLWIGGRPCCKEICQLSPAAIGSPLTTRSKLEFKVVTPDGHYRIANECQNKDLFWALRGGGGSTWGVVLETTHKAEPQMKLRVYVSRTWYIILISYCLYGRASIAFNQTATNVAPWLKLATYNALKWSKEGWGGHVSVSKCPTYLLFYIHTYVSCH